MLLLITSEQKALWKPTWEAADMSQEMSPELVGGSYQFPFLKYRSSKSKASYHFTLTLQLQLNLFIVDEFVDFCIHFLNSIIFFSNQLYIFKDIEFT